MTATTAITDRVVDAYLAGDVDTLAVACAEDVLVEVIVATWQFQISGRESIRHGLAQQDFSPGRRVLWQQRTGAAAGVLLEVEAWAPIHGEQRKWHVLNHFRIADGQIVELVQYCSGIWDAATIARQQAEAPTVRPR